MDQQGFTCVICGDWIDDPFASNCNTAEHEALGLLWLWEEANPRPSSKPKGATSPTIPDTLFESGKSITTLSNGSKDNTIPSSPTISSFWSEKVRNFYFLDSAA